MSDTTGNFSDNLDAAHGENWMHWLGHLAGKPGIRGLELGTWKGQSAEWWLTHILTEPTSTLICVDTFQGSPEHALAGIDCSGIEAETRVRLAPFGSRVSINRMQSYQWLLERAYNGPADLDFVYVDAAHDAMNVLRDSVLAFESLKPGGVMIWDDYEWRCMEAEVDRPKIAIDGFIASYGRQLEVIGMGWQVAAVKTA